LPIEIQNFECNYQEFISGAFLGKTPSMEIPSENTLLNNFSPN
jgi:hypothetical protein